MRGPMSLNTAVGGGMRHLVRLLLCLVLSQSLQSPPDGAASARLGQVLFDQGRYEEAAPELWQGVLFHANNPTYDVQAVFSTFIQCYVKQNRLADGLAFVAGESYRRQQQEMGAQYLQQALQVDPNNVAALTVQREFAPVAKTATVKAGNDNDDRLGDDLVDKSPEQLYEVASVHFSNKEYEDCADIFEISCQHSDYTLGPSCANAVYCRSMLADWGHNGTQFELDMARIVEITRREVEHYRHGNLQQFGWQRATSTHPHMMLGFPLPQEHAKLKRFVAESVAALDEKMARLGMSADGTTMPDLPADMPLQHDPATFQNVTKIRVGFVGSGFNSKAVLFLSHDMFRFFDRRRFEIHVFAFNAPDHPGFIEHGMRGVDWRQRVISNVDMFHDLQHLKDNHVEAARYIFNQHMHVLIEWDGYARQGERAQGLFALRPAPVQILHQEYLGTSGATYVDYLFTDDTVSPPLQQDLYVEKLIYLPNHFFSKGHAMQDEVKKPTYEYLPATTPYRPGTGNPRQNRCLAPKHRGPATPSFVFCNFNKFLKNNPETMRSWIHILMAVPDAMLCLLENPNTGVPYLRKFVHEAVNDGTLADDLNDRIHFLKWERNPFDHQMRNQDFCHVMLDSYPYNGHTVAQDALYGGVPIITRSDGVDMASRVSTSANRVLGAELLNAPGVVEYEQVAVQVASNATLYAWLRQTVMDAALQRNPMHPYWDVARYVKNFERGLEMAWQRFVSGQPPDHLYVQESEAAARGTYDEEIAAHPPQGQRQMTT